MERELHHTHHGLRRDDSEKAKLVFKVNTGAAVFGLGYIVGLKYSLIICLGSFAVWWLIIPLMSVIFHDQVLNAWNPAITETVGSMSPETIFREYGKSIGIGGIAWQELIGIIKYVGHNKGSGDIGCKRDERQERGRQQAAPHTARPVVQDHSDRLGSDPSRDFRLLLVGHHGRQHQVRGCRNTACGSDSFLFTTVAANAIAIVGSNPVSGMTLMTLILASVVMVAVGLKGVSGMVAALIMGGVVCTALSMSGCFITD